MSTGISRVIDDALLMVNRVDSDYRTRALRAVNRAVLFWADRVPWPALKTYETFIANGTRFLTLPRRVRRVVEIGDISNKIKVRDGAHWAHKYPDEFFVDTADSTPWEWRDGGLVPTIAAPSTDTKLVFQTTASEAMNVNISGWARDSTASGTAMELYEINETVNLGGTGVTETTNTYVKIRAIEKTTLDSASDLVIRSSTDSAPLARLTSDDRAAAYRQVEFLKVPGAGTQFRVEYYRRPERLVSENVPLEPSIDLDFLLWRTVGDLHWVASQQEAALAAWRKSEGLVQQRILAEKAHGEGNLQVQPDISYFDIEDIL
jgi:hypothetical protein